MVEENEMRYEEIQCEDADYIMVAFGTSARLCQKVIQLGRKKGLKLGLLRPITLWPFPKKPIADYADKVKGFLSVEMNAGQMVEDVLLAVNGKAPVEHYGKMGGMIASPSEILNALEEKLISKK
jgi:2-oxoglutarate ferredoxin oxidoreductase subunit alpha